MHKHERSEDSGKASELSGEAPAAARYGARSAAKRQRMADKLRSGATRGSKSGQGPKDTKKSVGRDGDPQPEDVAGRDGEPPESKVALRERALAERRETQARRVWKESELARKQQLREVRHAQKKRTLRRRGRLGSKERMRLAWRESGTFERLPDIDGVLRRLDDEHRGQPPRELESYAARILSQHGEDGITYELLKRAGIQTRVCVELGSGHNGGNAGFLVAGLNFSGLLADGDEEYVQIARATFEGHPVSVEACWIRREDVNELLAAHDIAGGIDYLGIDLDGVDWWIWEALTTISPRVVVVEYNPLFGAKEAVAVPYRPGFVRGERDDSNSFVWPKGAFGASLPAFERLARRRGYRLVGSAPNSQNVYFVRNDLALETPTISVEAAYRGPTKRRSVIRAEEIATAGGPTAWARAAGFELVQISEAGVPL